MESHCSVIVFTLHKISSDSCFDMYQHWEDRAVAYPYSKMQTFALVPVKNHKIVATHLAYRTRQFPLLCPEELEKCKNQRKETYQKHSGPLL